jgi:phenylacetate-CoA ligase
MPRVEKRAGRWYCRSVCDVRESTAWSPPAFLADLALQSSAWGAGTEIGFDREDMKVLRYLPRFQRAYRSLEHLRQRQAWSRGDIETFQLNRLNVLWRHAITHVPYYRELATNRDLPPSFSSLTEFCTTVPVLTKNALRAAAVRFVSEQAAAGCWRRSSGSTGKPLGFFWEHSAHREVLRCGYRFYADWGIDILDRSAFLWGDDIPYTRGGRLAIFGRSVDDLLRSRLRLSANYLGPNDLQRHLQKMEAFRPAMLYGLSQAVYLLARAALAGNVRLESLRAVVLTGETAFPHMIATIHHAFGVPTVVQYGAIECHFIAGQSADRMFRVREDIVLLETLPRSDGFWDIVLTILANHAMPLLRYAIEDVTEAPLVRPSQGFAILKNVLGRTDDMIFASSGRPIHATRIDAVFENLRAAIRRYHVHQQADGSLHVYIETGARGSLDSAGAIRNELQALIGDYGVRVERVEAVPQTPAGKHRVVASDLNPQTQA